MEVSNAKSINQFWESNPLFIKLFSHYTRGAKERQYIKDLLQPLVKEVLSTNEADLDIDPMNVLPLTAVNC
jgi:Ras GTPase-activating-like protein IQGAP2/3